jgi:hypothetical protein
MFVLGICCALALAVASAPAQSNGTAQVVRLKGAARASSGNFVWQPIKVGDVLQPGTMIQTSADPGSYMDLALGGNQTPAPQSMVYRPSIPSSFAPATTTFQPTSEQNTIRVWGDGILAIDILSTIQTGEQPVTHTQLDLKRGHLTGNVKKLSAASKYEIKFPNGVAGVRGTVFDIQAAGIIKVYLGSMVVAWVDPQTQKVTTQTITGGQSYDVSTSQFSALPTESMDELGQLTSGILVPAVFPTLTTLAVDRTAISMSPVGANPASVPAPVQSPPSEGGVVITYQNPPPPVSVITVEASRSSPAAGLGSPSGVKPAGPGRF